ncbi:MAG: RIP metalloprotease RseP [Akkermansiaceae bacterium]|nr:RIP metalloprotease RseP [Akkermansiaceae bacterium]
MNLLIGLGSIAVVIALFNVIIFVHELGHFLAARWRGLQVDRFQIWFGKPLWKKTINGVQYGLGWIPAGGFVALPQMAPMEAIEGDNRETGRTLAPVKPLDKIIVAFAGPLFSFLLALAAALVVWGVGKPHDFVATTKIGFVMSGGPADKAGLQIGDEIVSINGQPVEGFLGSLDSVSELIMLSEGETIDIVVKRPGVEEPLTLQSRFDIPERAWFRRKALRQIGIWVANSSVVGMVVPEGPADRAGLQEGDRILEIGGEEILAHARAREIIEASANEPLEFVIERDGQRLAKTVIPLIPVNAAGEDARAQIGIGFGPSGEVSQEIVHPKPFTQIGDSVRMMWVTITKIISPRSSVGAQHLAGPIGIGATMFDLLQIEHGWRRLIWFLVLFNVNLAILNMLPLPVLDGGHIVLAIGEMVAGRPVKARLLEVVQTTFALVLLCFFLFISSKDIGDRLGFGREAPVWPEPAAATGD